jgi:hypothetical protein
VNPRRRQQILLATLAVLVVWAGWRNFVAPALAPAGASRDGGRADGGRSGGRAGEILSPGDVLELDVEALAPGTDDYRPGRDPFRFGAPPAPPPRPRPVEVPKVVAAPPPGPQLPAVDLSYLGSFGPDDGLIAVLTDDAAIYNARQGDVIKKRFVLVDIGLESVDLGYVDFPDAPAKRLAVGQ